MTKLELSKHKVFNKKGFYVKEIDKQTAFDFITTYHYSKQLPRLTKHCLGFYTPEDILVGGLTLGWGTRPKHTIQKFWSDLESQDYYEIGKMALDDAMPRNSESQFLSMVCTFIKQVFPKIKVLFTWADGMLGKAGYVYQASNFYYAGSILTDTYFTSTGERVHPRTASSFKQKGKSTEEKSKTPTKQRPTMDELSEWGWTHIKGKQIKYLFFLCNKREKKRLMRTTKEEINRNYPKDEDLMWKIKVERGVWKECDKPEFNKQAVEIYKADKTLATEYNITNKQSLLV